VVIIIRQRSSYYYNNRVDCFAEKRGDFPFQADMSGYILNMILRADGEERMRVGFLLLFWKKRSKKPTQMIEIMVESPHPQKNKLKMSGREKGFSPYSRPNTK
jgi:hypothetical protein